MASYQGSPFEAGVGPTDSDLVLFAACPPPEDLGFEPATGHWRKQVPIRDVQAVWESRPVGLFRGARCMVLDDLGDRLHIGYLGHDAHQAERLGYWQVDRGVYELVAARIEVSEIIEERTEYPRKAPPRGSSPSTQAERPGQSQVEAPDYSGYPSAESSGYLSSTPTGSSPGYLPSGPIGYRASSDSGTYSWTYSPADTGSFRQVEDTGSLGWPGYQSGPADVPAAGPRPAEEAPLPLEAAAMRAATESRRRPRQTAAQRRAAAAPPAASRAPESPPVGDQESASRLAPEPAMVGAAQLSETAAAPAATRPSPAEDSPAFTAAAAPAASAGPATPTTAAPAGPAAAQGARASASPAGRGAQAAFSPAPASLAGGSPSASAPLLAPDARPAEATRPAEVSAGVQAAAGYATADQADPLAPDAGPAWPRHTARRRLATERLFAELANLAAIPADSYAVGEEVDGALCLLQTDQGFEVFHSANGNRHELQLFSTEESACFYLFGVLAAEAVRTGALGPHSGGPPFARPPR
jgi:hypothetical protein